MMGRPHFFTHQTSAIAALFATALQARKPANLQTCKRCFLFSVGEKKRKERRIKVVVVVVGGVETVENPKIPQKPVPEGLFGGFVDNPDRKTNPETV